MENPLECYDLTMVGSRDEMLAQILSVYDSTPFAASTTAGQ
jgi:hypothetical protein